ncbi:polysialyltransferase family glycosyltransferase [Thalassobacillus hwangdonensis]|uniref:Polysialyltransferase family glycosyltransferase n=1 Tax=Thalassobacillus hwangdonensis TaxID=546108 RepID=A0ABW3L3T6_9BACI
MKGTVLIVMSSNYQMLFSYLLSKVLRNHTIHYFLMDTKNEQINDDSRRLFSSNPPVFFEALKKDWRSLLFRNRKILKSIEKTIHELQPDHIILYKDNDHCHVKIIETAATMGSSVTMIQEGLGVYAGKSTKKLPSLSMKLLECIGYPKIWNLSQGYHPLLTTLAVGEPELLPADKKIEKCVIPIPKYPPEEWLEEIVQYLSIDRGSRLRNVALYLGQPLVKLGLADEELEKKTLQELFQLLDAKGYDILVKAHPFEPDEKYDRLSVPVTKVENSIPAELLPSLYKIRAVLTPYSSAGYNLHTWYGIPTIYLHKLLLKEPLSIANMLVGKAVTSSSECGQLMDEVNKNMTDERNVTVDSTREFKSFLDQILQPGRRGEH